METNKFSVFPPKGTDGRYKDIMVLHIQGLVLVLVLIVMLWASLSILGRSMMSILFDAAGGMPSESSFTPLFEILGITDAASAGISFFTFIFKTLGALSYVAAFVSIAATAVLIYFMKKRIAMIVDDGTPYENPIKVKKTKFVLLGFLLGAYGGHLFALKKKRAWIFLIMGILGMEFIPLFIYTSGISFADAFMACFIDKDSEGYIKMEDYPYWI